MQQHSYAIIFSSVGLFVLIGSEYGVAMLGTGDDRLRDRVDDAADRGLSDSDASNDSLSDQSASDDDSLDGNGVDSDDEELLRYDKQRYEIPAFHLLLFLQRVLLHLC
jgi:hypothetical protein